MTLRALFVIALTLVSSASGASDTLIISDAWVRATPPGKMMTAGYASLENVSKDVITITGCQQRLQVTPHSMRPVLSVIDRPCGP